MACPQRQISVPHLTAMLGNTSIHPERIHQERASNPNFNVELSSDVQQVEFSTTAHHSEVILPHFLANYTNKENIMLLVMARWNEHMIEDILLTPRSNLDGLQYQQLLMRHRIERAKLEIKLYADAMTKQAQTLAERTARGIDGIDGITTFQSADLQAMVQ